MRPRTSMLVAALILLPPRLAAQDWFHARSCLKNAPEATVREFAVLTPGADSTDTYCLHLADGTSVCATLSPYYAYNDSGTITLRRPHEAVRHWHVVATRRWGGHATRPDTADIEAFVADLGGDGASELVVAVNEATLGGMAISYWSVTIVRTGRDAVPQTVQTTEYSSRGSWVRLPGQAQCFFLATNWRNLGIEPRRGSGWYLVGGLRPFVGAVLSDSVLPLLRARRRLDSLGTRPGAEPEPLGLLTDPRARTIDSVDRRLVPSPFKWWQ